MRTVWVCDTVTGARIAQLPASSFTWQLRMNGRIGTGQATFETRARELKEFSSGDWEDMKRPWARTLVLCEDGRPFYAGTITGMTDYDFDTGVLTLAHAEIGELLRRRLFFSAATYSGTTKFGFTEMSRQGILVEAARIAAGGGFSAPIVGSNPRRLPIFIPDATAGTRAPESFQHEFERPWEWMTQIPDEVNGEDFAFEPGFGAGGLQYVMHVGNPMLSRSSVEWNISAEKSPAMGPRVKWDASDQWTGMFVLGKGMGSKMRVGRAVTERSGLPAMEGVLSRKDIVPQTQVNAAAAGKMARTQDPVPVWSFGGRAEAVLAPMNAGTSSGVRPGSRVRLVWAGDRVMGTGYADHYVTGMSGDLGDVVTLEVQAL